MGSPSFKGFHVRKQESNTFNTRIVCIVSCSNKKNNRTKQNRKDEKHSQISINIKIHANYDGVRAIAIMLRSLIAISAHRKGERLIPFPISKGNFVFYYQKCIIVRD